MEMANTYRKIFLRFWNDIKNPAPVWWSAAYEAACLDAHGRWCAKLYEILDTKAVIVNPFTITPPRKITRKHIALLHKWDSVRDSVWASVGDYAWAYAGTFFKLPRSAWEYTENIKTTGYPFQPAADLWEMGLAPSCDGKIWRLHGGPDAKILWEGEITK